MKRIILTVFLAILLLGSISFAGSQEARVLRTPTIHSDQIVFAYAGDLYTVSAGGGIARKLTTHDGYEIFPRFSHDGKTIAFTGEYDGNREVYVIPREGGVPQRLTFSSSLGRDHVWDRMGPNNLVMGWKHNNTQVVFRSRNREWNSFNGQLFLTAVEGGLPEQLPLPRGGFCSFSPDDSKMAYNRIFREFRTWKRYRGGMADDIWIYDFETKQIENITQDPAQDIIPMWTGSKIYFLSDRDENKRMNLFVYDTESKETDRLTEFVEYDIKFPSLGQKAIVFENGGYLYRFDLESEETSQVPVIIADDMKSGREKLVKLAQQITNYEISPDGKRALFGARGEIFTVPAKHGNTRNLTSSSGIHERNSKWSPDGKWIAYVSDTSGEDEIYILSQDGIGDPIQLTTDADTYKYELLWSPDSKKILWGDKNLRLNYVHIQSRETVEVAQAEAWEMRDFCWSPDSQWIAYSKQEVETMPKIYLYSLASKKSFEVTDGWYSSRYPAFHSEGKYLFFYSERDFNPVFSSVEFNFAYLARARIYMVTLSKEVKNPFEPQSDEVAIKKEESKEKKTDDTKTKKKSSADQSPEKDASAIKVDPAGLKNRIIRLPIEVANYWALNSVKDSLYYMKRGARDTRASLKIYDLKNQKETDLGHINGYEISSDQKKMLVNQNRSYSIIDLPKSPINIKEKLDLSHMDVFVDLKDEWAQIFEECWRQMKYFFYAANMHGVDWDLMKKRYQPLAEAVNHRTDLTYVIGEMIGELNVGHTYVGGGDTSRPERIDVGVLGARLNKDEATGFFKVSKILNGQNWDPNLRSPLTEVGVSVNEGDYIIAVNGKLSSSMSNIYEHLLNMVGKQVTLKINSKPEEQGAWETVVVPIKDELALRYFNMVQTNIEKVSKATNGRVGYIHIPDMGVSGLNEFVKYFYPQLRKEALIIDVRGNGGGFVSALVVERLRREMVAFGMARNTAPGPDPGEAFLGPMVCLQDEFSASDGDIFPFRFKKYNLGKTIGKRTWGGVVGIRNTLPLLDGGYLNRPEFAMYSEDGKWIIEGVGVEPDIKVENDPAKEYAGIDEQLNKGIEVILQELETKGKTVTPVPKKFPDKKK